MLHLTGLCEITGTHDNTLMLASGTATRWLVGGVSVTIPHPFIGHRLNANDRSRSRHVAFKPGGSWASASGCAMQIRNLGRMFCRHAAVIRRRAQRGRRRFSE